MPRPYKSVPNFEQSPQNLVGKSHMSGPSKDPAGITREQAGIERLARLNNARSINARSNDHDRERISKSSGRSDNSGQHGRKKDTYDSIEAKNSHAYDEHAGIKDVENPKLGAYIRRNQDAFGIQAGKTKVKHPLLKGLSKSSLKRGIIYSEVLGKPRGLQD